MSLANFSDLKRKSVRGGLISVGSQGFTVAIQLVSTVILARLFTPEDFGALAMVPAVIVFAALFRDMGLSSAAIQKQGLTSAQQSNLFWLNVLMGAFLTIIVASATQSVLYKPDDTSSIKRAVARQLAEPSPYDSRTQTWEEVVARLEDLLFVLSRGSDC